MVIDCIFHDLIAAKLYLHSLFFLTLNLHKYLQNWKQSKKASGSYCNGGYCGG